MRVVIFGTGAMACLFGARLAPVAEVTIVGTWADAIAAIRQRGLLIEGSTEIQSIPVRAQSFEDSPVAADLVLVLVKSWQTIRIASQLEKYMRPEATGITLQNGLGNVEILGPRVLPGTTGEGATLVGPGHVKVGGTGRTWAVAPDRVIRLLRQAGFEALQCSKNEADSVLWSKLCVSCGINALTALLRVENGELLKRPDACELMLRATEECAGVARAKGIPLAFQDPVEHVKEVARNTARNRSSMYQDILRGAPTECDAIYGAVVREAEQLGVDAEINGILWKLVRAAVHSYGANADNADC